MKSKRGELVTRRSLITLLWFGAVSALAGGILGVFFNGAGVPLRYLDGTSFGSYLVPGLLLAVVVGGTQAAAVMLLHRRSSFALIASTIAGFGMLVWIFAELATISAYSPLQTVYFSLGGLELVLVLLLLGILSSVPQPAFVRTGSAR